MAEREPYPDPWAGDEETRLAWRLSRLAMVAATAASIQVHLLARRPGGGTNYNPLRAPADQVETIFVDMCAMAADAARQLAESFRDYPPPRSDA